MKKFLTLIILALFLLNSCTTETPPSYTVGLDPLWYSMDIPEREKNLLGFTSDILKEISLSQKINIEILLRNWDNLIDGLKEKKYQGILSTLYPYSFYLNKYDFSDLFLATGPVLVVPSHSSVTSLEGLIDKQIGVQEGSEGALIIKMQPHILMRNYTSIPQALNALSNGEIDGAIVNILAAEAYCKDLYFEKLKILPPILNDQGIRLLTLHNQNRKFIEKFNMGLKKMHKNGKYKELQQKWSLGPT